MIGNTLKKTCLLYFSPVHFESSRNCIYFIMNKTDFNSEQNFDRQGEKKLKRLQLLGFHESFKLINFASYEHKQLFFSKWLFVCHAFSKTLLYFI